MPNTASNKLLISFARDSPLFKPCRAEASRVPGLSATAVQQTVARVDRRFDSLNKIFLPQGAFALLASRRSVKRRFPFPPAFDHLSDPGCVTVTSEDGDSFFSDRRAFRSDSLDTFSSVKTNNMTSAKATLPSTSHSNFIHNSVLLIVNE